MCSYRPAYLAAHQIMYKRHLFPLLSCVFVSSYGPPNNVIMIERASPKLDGYCFLLLETNNKFLENKLVQLLHFPKSVMVF